MTRVIAGIRKNDDLLEAQQPMAGGDRKDDPGERPFSGVWKPRTSSNCLGPVLAVDRKPAFNNRCSPKSASTSRDQHERQRDRYRPQDRAPSAATRICESALTARPIMAVHLSPRKDPKKANSRDR